MRKLRVVVDCDDVLVLCNEYALHLMNKRHGTNFTMSEIRSWREGPYLKERLELFRDPAFVTAQPLYDGARDFVRQLTKTCEIFIMTSVPAPVVPARVEFILKNFPEIDPGNIIIGGRKDIMDVDIVLDDAIHNLTDSSAAYPVLFRRPWNETETGMLSVTGFGEFLELVATIQDRSLNKVPDPEKVKAICLCGPSGCGKNFLLESLTAKDPRFVHLRSYTDRDIRPGDTGREYNFLSKEKFASLQQDGFFCETSCYHGNHYGTSKAEVEAARTLGVIPVLILDINGVLRMKRIFGEGCLSIFVERDFRDCIQSILERGGSPEVNAERIASIPGEMQNRQFCSMSLTSMDADRIIDLVR